MSRFMRDRGLRDLERRLRNERPAPPETLMARFAPARRTRPQLAFASGLTALLLVALASVGGISYAGNVVSGVYGVAKSAVAPAKHRDALVIRGLSSGGDQYRPGYGFGDENHNHTGPPGLTSAGGEKAPPLQSRPEDSFANVVGTKITLDEQAHLYISVIDKDGTPLLLTQKSKRGGSSLGSGLTGPQTKFISYLVLVPRTIPMQIRIPDNLLTKGEIYRIRVVAVDPDGNKKTVFIPFRG
jgi:hypothetical protein